MHYGHFRGKEHFFSKKKFLALYIKNILGLWESTRAARATLQLKNSGAASQELYLEIFPSALQTITQVSLWPQK